MNVFKVNYKDSQTIPIVLQPETVKFSVTKWPLPIKTNLTHLQPMFHFYFAWKH